MALVAALGGAELAGACCPVRVIARLLLGSHQPPATQQKGYESWRVVAGGCHHQNTDSSPGNIMGEGQWDIGNRQEEEGQSCESQLTAG